MTRVRDVDERQSSGSMLQIQVGPAEMLCHGDLCDGTARDRYVSQNVDAVLRDVLGFRFVFRLAPKGIASKAIIRMSLVG